jgi:hypothetical protein
MYRTLLPEGKSVMAVCESRRVKNIFLFNVAIDFLNDGLNVCYVDFDTAFTAYSAFTGQAYGSLRLVTPRSGSIDDAVANVISQVQPELLVFDSINAYYHTEPESSIVNRKLGLILAVLRAHLKDSTCRLLVGSIIKPAQLAPGLWHPSPRGGRLASWISDIVYRISYSQGELELTKVKGEVDVDTPLKLVGKVTRSV